MMTLQEKKAKRILIKLLSEQGYRTYANILNLFDLHLTSNPNAIGYMEPDKGTITLNRGLDMDQVSVIVRHEILHEYLQHMRRILKKLNAPSLNITDYKNRKVDPEDLTISDLILLGYDHLTGNIAGDYEISNLGYTEEDKNIARQIKLNGETLQGLVTEDQHPDWVDYSFEDMYDALIAERQKEDPTPDDIDQGDQGNDLTGDTGDSGQQGQSSDQGLSGSSDLQGNDLSNDQNGDNDQSNSDNDSQYSNDADSSGQDSSSNKSGNDSSLIIRGRFIDETTFETEDGQIIRL